MSSSKTVVTACEHYYVPVDSTGQRVCVWCKAREVKAEQRPSKEQNIQPATEFLTGLRHCTATAERVILERADFFRLLSLADRGAAPEPCALPEVWMSKSGTGTVSHVARSCGSPSIQAEYCIPLYRAAQPPAAEPQWVSVSDRLPDYGKSCVYFGPDIGSHLGFYDGKDDDGLVMFAGKSGFTSGDVTHYIPLPPRPTSTKSAECGACDKPGEHCSNQYGICSRAGGHPQTKEV